MLHRLIGCVEGILSFVFLPLKYSANVVLRSLNVHGTCPKADIEKYYSFKESVDNGVIIFNHPTFYDHIVIMKELNDTPRFVMYKHFMKGPFKWVANKLNAIGIDNKAKGASSLIANEIRERQFGDHLVIVSPTGGKASQSRPWYLYPFKTGAFITRPKVLPIILYYVPYAPWHSSDLSEQVFKRLKGDKISYIMRVLDPMEATENESITEFADRCRKTMIKELYTIHKEQTLTQQKVSDDSMGSINSFFTSHLFLICGIAAILNHIYLYGIGMCIVFLTSWLYHGTGDVMWRRVDIISNIMMAVIFGLMLLKSQQYTPLVFLTFACISYVLKLEHSIFVHIPIALGFSSIH